ncbi:MAG: hypothetical protein LBG69_02700 [Zoogloeaceae bacterium]|jgi:folate-binding protein YgfZ|nr:hypothetical protein [Zoogloeaceae bacterium]
MRNSQIRLSPSLRSARDFPRFSEISEDDAALVPFLPFSSLLARGADARAFLHGQCTSDLAALPENEAQHSAWCSAQGRVLANFFLYALPKETASGENFRLFMPDDLTETVRSRLSRYLLRAQATLEEETELAHFGLIGRAAVRKGCAALEILLPAILPPLAVHHADGISLLALPDNRRFVLSAPKEKLSRFYAAISAALPVFEAELWSRLDIESGFPWITAATADRFVPQMLNLEELGALSFTKGCYPGQEVVARAQYLGEVKRRLYRLEGRARDVRALMPGSALLSPDDPEHDAGHILSLQPQAKATRESQEHDAAVIALAVARVALAHALYPGADEAAQPFSAAALYPSPNA